jgi:hypothetical protein
MRNDQIGPLLDRFPRAFGGDGQTRHHLSDFPFPIADKQTDVIPIFS